MTRILHFSDLHLDRSFAGLGMATSEANKRREELRAALRRIVALAVERGVDVVTIGGDLYEHDRVTPDTANFIRDQFARLAPRKVLVAPGNHDPYLPDSLYWRLEWPDNVHVFDSMTWEAVEAAGCRFWGVAHRGLAIRDNLLERLTVSGAGPNIALLHGSDTAAIPEGKETHCPFQAADVERCGADFVLLGHYHEMRLRPVEGPRYGYPGSPEPLNFGEGGPHYVFLAEASAGGVSVEPVQINDVWYRSEELDVSGLVSSDAVRELIQALSGRAAAAAQVVRVVLTGQPAPELDLDSDALLHSCAPFFRYLELLNRTDAPLDTDQIRSESTTRGAFVRLMEERLAATPPDDHAVLELALQYGLQAFAGTAVRRR